MSPFWILLELRMMEVVVTTGAIRPAKLQYFKLSPQTNQHPVFYRPDAMPVAWLNKNESSIAFTIRCTAKLHM